MTTRHDKSAANDNPSHSTSGNRSNSGHFKPNLTHRPPYIKYLVYSLLVVGGFAGIYVLTNQELRAQVYEFVFNPQEDFSKYVTKTVEKDAFKVTVEAKGTVDSSRNSSLVNNVEGETTIISIVPAGTMVQEPLRAKFSPGPGVKAVVKEIRNLSSRTPTVVIEERTPKRSENGDLVDEQGQPIVDEEGNPAEDFEKAAYDTRELEFPYEMSVYSELMVAVGDEVEYDEILIGDLVCELDASSLVDEEKQQQIAVTQAKADLEKGEKNVEIQIAQNESDIAAAKLEMQLADLDLKKYLGMEGAREVELIDEAATDDEGSETKADGSESNTEKGPEAETDEASETKPETELKSESDADETLAADESLSDETLAEIEAALKKEPDSQAGQTTEEKLEGGEFEQERRRIAGEIELKKQELKRAQDQYDFINRVSLKGYKTNDEVEQALLAVNEAKFRLLEQQMALNVLQKYTKERTIAELLHLKRETIRNLDRVKLAGEAALVQFQAELESRTLSYNVQVSQLERLQKQIEACKLIAPQAGQVVYANEHSRRSEPVIIEEGATVRERQKLINLPDMSAMKVDARIHESKISDVVPSLDVVIRVDAIPGHVYTGVLETVSSVPLPGSWPNTDLKEYEAVAKILDEGEWLNQLKPGMSANIEIIVDESSEKMLQLPVQAAVDIDQSYYAWVLTKDGPERRSLKLGRSNDVKFVVKEGLEEGDEVIMNPRHHFSEEIAKLEAESVKKAQEARRESSETAKANKDSNKPSDSSFPQNEQPGNATAQRPRGGGQGGNREEFFARQDKNEDGELSGDEISDGMKKNLSNIDKNGDGKLSKAEFMAARPPGGGGRNAGKGRNGGGNTRGAE